MREYALITLNMIEYTGIYLKKPSAEYPRILNVSDAGTNRPLYKGHKATVHKATVQITQQLYYRRIQNTAKHLRLQKNNA